MAYARSSQGFARRWRPLAATLAGLCLCAGALAQSYPQKPIRLVVPYPPGGVDLPARAMVPAMQAALGQPIVVDTRGGANGIIGAEIVARAPADGYTLLFPASSTIVGAAKMTRDIPWDPILSLIHI